MVTLHDHSSGGNLFVGMRNWYCVDDTPVLRQWEYYGDERRSLRTMLSGKFVAAGFCFSRLMGLVHTA